MPSLLATVIQTLRPPFLLLTPACLLVGIGTARLSGPLDLLLLTLVLLGALCAHISVNMLNEYEDFRSGLDLQTQRTAFSGGSGALPQRPQAASLVLALGLVALAVTVLCGLYFIWLRGWGLLPLGLAGCALVLAYTRWINRLPWLCLIAPGLGVGPLMVGGTHFVLTGHYAALPFFLSLVPFFLANNLLLLNQYPDLAADRAAGRRHFLIAYGHANAAGVYGLFVLAAYSIIVSGVLGNLLPALSALALLPLPLALWSIRGPLRFATDIPRLKPYMAMNVAVNLLTPALLGLSLYVTATSG